MVFLHNRFGKAKDQSWCGWECKGAVGNAFMEICIADSERFAPYVVVKRSTVSSVAIKEYQTASSQVVVTLCTVDFWSWGKYILITFDCGIF